MKPETTGIISAVGSITIDEYGLIQSFDAVSERLFGYKSSDVLGKNITTIMPEPYRSEHDGYLSRFRKEGDPHIIGKGREVSGQRKDGTVFPIWLAVNEVNLGSERVFVGSVLDLSEQKSIEADLAKSLEMTRAILETAVNPIITIGSAGIIRSFNRAAEKLFGYTRQEVVGQNVKMLMPESYSREHDGYLSRYLNNGQPKVIGKGREVEGMKKDGSTFPMHLSVGEMEIAGGRMFVGIIADMTEQKAIEAEIRQHRDHLEELVAIATAEVKAIIQTAVNGIITIDEHGLIHIFNPSAEQLFGWTKEEVVGKNVSILMEEPFASKHDGYLADFFKTGRANVIGIGREVMARRKDGTTFPAHLAVGHMELSETRHFFVGFIADITEQKENEEELKQAKEAAEAGVQAKSAFIANMSHEIRTPMNAIIGFAEVALQDSTLSEQTEKHIKTIHSSAKALLGIINDILDVSKLESGKFALEEVTFNLPNMMADAMRTVEHRAMEKGLEIGIEYNKSLPVRFMGDPTRLRQIILNLVGNAIKFTENGSVTITVQSRNNPNELHFTVSDTGIGMTEEQTAKVFESFSQADVSTTRRFGGTGLGTSISKQIVELMGGKIWVESELGEGSKFHFTAQMSESSDSENCLYEGRDSIPEGYRSPRLFRILLAEDIEANATLAQLRLKQQGHEVNWVENGQEAIDAFQKEEYDLILMDVMMPDVDGLEATRRIRELEKEQKRRTPILALSASVMLEDTKRCYDAGMDGFESKPIEFNHLFSTMEQLVPPESGRVNTQSEPDSETYVTVDFSPLEGVVNHKKAIETWKDPLVYAKALHSFITDRSQDAERMREQLQKHPNNPEPARAIAHALKGVSGNLSIEQVSNLATEIDILLKKGEIESATSKLERLQQALQEAVTIISKVHMPDSTPKALKNSFDPAQLQQLLSELLSTLDELNPDLTEPVLSQIAEYLEKNELSSIQKEIDAFDFDKAKEETKALAEKLGFSLNN